MQIAEKLAIENGILSYIIPNTYLFNTFAAKYRIQILKTWNVIEILDCTKFPIFESAVVRNTINTWQKKHIRNDINSIGYRNTSGALSFNELIAKERDSLSSESLVNMNQNWGLAFMLSLDKINVVSHICENKTKLECLFPELSQGLIAYDKYKGQSREIIESRAYHYNSFHDGLKKWLWGEDVNRFALKWNGQEYIDYCDGIANPRNPKFFIGKRLLIREITNPSIYATVTSEELYNDPAVIIVKDSPLYSINVCLAILNSKLATFYHFNHSPKATKGAFPKILVQDIKEFPLPAVSDLSRITIDRIVEDILNTKKNTPSANTSALEQQIDLLVYHLYGLTYDEVLIIDSKTHITREEYKRE